METVKTVPIKAGLLLTGLKPGVNEKTGGVHYVVSFGGQPVSVDEDIIKIVQDLVDQSGFLD